MFLLPYRFFFFLDKENICFRVVFEFIYAYVEKANYKVTTQKNNLKRNRLLINPIIYDNTNFDRLPDNENKVIYIYIFHPSCKWLTKIINKYNFCLDKLLLFSRKRSNFSFFLKPKFVKTISLILIVYVLM